MSLGYKFLYVFVSLLMNVKQPEASQFEWKFALLVL